MNAWMRFWLGESCRLCSAGLLPLESGICTGCLGVLPFAWMRNSLPLVENEKQHINMPIRSWLLFSEHNAVRTLIHRIKYQSDAHLAFDLGCAMAKDFRSDSAIDWPDVFIPVPLHAKRRRQRGYNQSEMLAKGLASVGGGRIDTHSLIRQLHSESQTKNSRKGRTENVEQAFLCTRSKPPEMPLKIALVDDVITTGSTLKSCCMALNRSGFTQVEAWTLACSGWLD